MINLYIKLILFSATLAISSIGFPNVELATFNQNGEIFYAIYMTTEPTTQDYTHITEHFRNGGTRDNYRPPVLNDSLSNVTSDILTLNKILFEGTSLLEAPDFIEAFNDPLFGWKGYAGSPYESLHSLVDFERNIMDLLAEYADYFKWKSYQETGTIPEILDIPNLRARSPLLSDRSAVVLFLDSQKNFAGLVSIAYPTRSRPLLPAEELLTSLKERGLANPSLEIPKLTDFSEVAANSVSPLFINSNFDVVRSLPNLSWLSLTAELKSIVKNRSITMDIMPISIMMLEAMRNSQFIPLNHSRENAILNNGVAREGSLPYLHEGQYVATASPRLSILHKRMGWEELFRIGDLVYLRASREVYLNTFFNRLDQKVGNTTLNQIRESAKKSSEFILQGPEREPIPSELAQKLNDFTANRSLSCKQIF